MTPGSHPGDGLTTVVCSHAAMLRIPRWTLFLIVLSLGACSTRSTGGGQHTGMANGHPHAVMDAPPATAASQAAAAHAAQAIDALESADPARRQRARLRFADLVADHKAWPVASSELTVADRERAAVGLAPALQSDNAMEREHVLRAMVDVLRQADGPPPGAAPSATRYAERLLDRRGLSDFEAANRGMQLEYVLGLMGGAEPTEAGRAVVARIQADPELRAQAEERNQLGWSSAAGALTTAQRLGARWDGAPTDAR